MVQIFRSNITNTVTTFYNLNFLTIPPTACLGWMLYYIDINFDIEININIKY